MRQLVEAPLPSALDASTPVSAVALEDCRAALPAPQPTTVATLTRPRAPLNFYGSLTTRADSPADPVRSRYADARGPRGEVRFFLQRVIGGLYVEREDIPRRGPDSSTPSDAWRPTDSSDGATSTQCDTNSRDSTSTSCARPMNSGSSTRPCEIAPPAEEGPTLAQFVAVHGYADRVTTHIERIPETADQPALLDLLHRCAIALGADNAIFVSFVRDDADISTCRFMFACAPEWCQRYLDINNIAHDPWLAYATHHSEPIVASTLRVVDHEARRVVDLANRHGFASAVLAPAHDGPGHSRISLLCLGSTRAGYFEGGGVTRFKLHARLLAAEMHAWWMRRIRRELVFAARITPADLVLLRHEAQGHSSKHIAAAHQVSVASINSRFQRMNAKLGVPNRRMAARSAAQCGLLD